MKLIKEYFIADDDTEKISLLLRLRLPWLLVGLIGGTVASLIVSQFQLLLSKNISLAFFVPIIMYMSDAVGEQTENIYVRNSAKKRVNFFTYLFKEFFLGIIIGLIFGLIVGVFSYFWLRSFQIALTVSLAMFATIVIAPILALIIVQFLSKEHTDPALGAGPFTTIFQEIISLIIYFLIATTILLNNPIQI